jgi:hypothetical protein
MLKNWRRSRLPQPVTWSIAASLDVDSTEPAAACVRGMRDI